MNLADQIGTKKKRTVPAARFVLCALNWTTRNFLFLLIELVSLSDRGNVIRYQKQLASCFRSQRQSLVQR